MQKANRISEMVETDPNYFKKIIIIKNKKKTEMISRLINLNLLS